MMHKPPDDLDGALALFVEHTVASAVRPQPWLALGAGLCALGTLMGRKYRTETNLRSNLMATALAGSGAGKDHARDVIKEALLAAGLRQHLGGNRLASGAGLLAALSREPATLFQLDEFGGFLAAILSSRAPKYLAEIWDLLTELYTSAGSTFLGTEYADQKERPRIDIAQPCLCLHATSVPETFWAALRQGSLVDGSLARFMVFAAEDGIPDRTRRPRPVGDVPAELVEALRAVAAGVGGGGDLAGVGGGVVVPQPYTVPMAPDAERLFDELDDRTTARQRKATGTNASAVLARVWENTARVALIKAVSAAPQAPVIRGEDAVWAQAVVEQCVTALLTEGERHISDNRTESHSKRVLRLIQDAGDAGLTKSDVTRRTQFLSKHERNGILESLVEGKLVASRFEMTAGAPRTTYHAPRACRKSNHRKEGAA